MADRSLPAEASALVDLIRAYVKQETVEPLKGLFRFVRWGFIGALALGIGTVLLALGLLRFLQTETGGRLDNNLSFVPYLIVLVVCTAVAVLAATRIAKKASRR